MVSFLQPTARVDLGTSNATLITTYEVQKDINSFMAANNSNATCTVRETGGGA